MEICVFRCGPVEKIWRITTAAAVALELVRKADAAVLASAKFFAKAGIPYGLLPVHILMGYVEAPAKALLRSAKRLLEIKGAEPELRALANPRTVDARALRLGVRAYTHADWRREYEEYECRELAEALKEITDDFHKVVEYLRANRRAAYAAMAHLQAIAPTEAARAARALSALIYAMPKANAALGYSILDMAAVCRALEARSR